MKIECGTLCLVKLVIKIIFSVIQAEMAIVYAFKLNEGENRNVVGSFLVALWVIWAVYVMLKAMNILFTDDN